MTAAEENLLRQLVKEVSNVAKEMKSFNEYIQNPAKMMESWTNSEEEMSKLISQQFKVMENLNLD